jgi:ElaB/YqjD/DUF883 family membrane-anchored ribosome-binding protein
LEPCGWLLDSIVMKTEDLTSSAGANRIREWQGVVSDKAKDLSAATDRYVQDNPWKTVAIAAIVGCILGFLMRPRD